MGEKLKMAFVFCTKIESLIKEVGDSTPTNVHKMM